MFDITHICVCLSRCVWHDSICDITLCATWPTSVYVSLDVCHVMYVSLHVCDMTHTHVCDMTHWSLSGNGMMAWCLGSFLVWHAMSWIILCVTCDVLDHFLCDTRCLGSFYVWHAMSWIISCVTRDVLDHFMCDMTGMMPRCLRSPCVTWLIPLWRGALLFGHDSLLFVRWWSHGVISSISNRATFAIK